MSELRAFLTGLDALLFKGAEPGRVFMHPRTYAFTRRWWGQLGKPFRERVELLVEQERPREGYAAVLLSPYKEGPRERQVWVSDSIPEWSVRIVAGSRG